MTLGNMRADGVRSLAGGDRGEPGAAGLPGPRGTKGAEGDKGEHGATIVGWQIERPTYRTFPVLAHGQLRPELNLRELFEQYHGEVG